MAASLLQNRLFSHVPVDNDADWTDVEISLPDALGVVRGQSNWDLEDEARVRALFAIAISDRFVHARTLAEAVPRDALDPTIPDAQFEANVRLVLGDLGVLIEDETWDGNAPSEAERDGDEEVDATTQEAIQFLRELNSWAVNPLARYLGDVQTMRLLSASEEVELAKSIEEGVKESLGAIACCPAAMDELRDVAREVALGRSSGRRLFAVMGDPADAPPDGTPTEDADYPGSAEVDEPQPEPASEAAARLAVLEKLRLQMRDAPNPGSQAVVDAAETLFALRLSVPFLTRLQRITQATGEVWVRASLASGLSKAEEARKTLVEGNLRLVLWCARKHGGLPFDDLVQAGNLGLLTAADRFDHRRGYRFSTYATHWIRQVIFRTVADSSRTIRVPVYLHDRLNKLRRFREGRLSNRSVPPTLRECAAELSVSESKVPILLTLLDEPECLDAFVENRENGRAEPSTLLDPSDGLGEGHPGILAEQARQAIEEQLSLLKPKQQRVIRMRFGLGFENQHTLEEIAHDMGLTRQRINQIEAKALAALAHGASGRRLAVFL